MPKIIKNGVTYIGTSDNAAAVSYDNTSSGLSATNVQGAIDEVDNELSNKMNKVNPTGSGNFSFNATATSGMSNVNLCSGGRVGGLHSFACGYNNVVGGSANIVGGYNNSATEVTITDDQGQEQTYFSNYNAVFGSTNTVNGGSYNIIAGHSNTCTAGEYNSLSGCGLKASSNYQHICGRWNKTLTGVVEIVGWGSSDSNRANIRTLSTAGNEVLAGTIEAEGLGATLKHAVIDAIYPVGSIYMTVTDNTAAKVKARFGGTWVAWGSGRVPVGVDTSQTEFDTVEETGGEKTHPLSTTEMPAHRHALHIAGGTTTRPSAGAITSGSWSSNVTKYYQDGSYMEDFGSGVAHNNLQPYITCYMWKRTA